MSSYARAVSVRPSARIFAIGAILVFALLKSAVAQNSIIRVGPNDAPLELNVFLHGAGTSAPTLPTRQAAPAMPLPRSSPPRPQTSLLSVVTPSARRPAAVKQEPPLRVKHDQAAEKAAGGRFASTRRTRMAPPLTPLSPEAVVVRATNPELSFAAEPPLQPNAGNAAEAGPTSPPPSAASTAESAPEPVVAVAAAGLAVQPAGGDPADVKPMSASPDATNMPQSAPDLAVAAVATVATAAPPVRLEGRDPAEVKPMSTPLSATDAGESAPEPDIAVVGSVTVGPPILSGGTSSAEVMSTPPGATSAAESTPDPVAAAAVARQIPETAEPVVAVVRTAASVELNELNLAAGPPVQPSASNPAEVKTMSTARAPSRISALRVVMLGLGPAMAVGFLAWGMRRQLTSPFGRDYVGA
jgi:hypothetical protein